MILRSTGNFSVANRTWQQQARLSHLVFPPPDGRPADLIGERWKNKASKATLVKKVECGNSILRAPLFKLATC